MDESLKNLPRYYGGVARNSWLAASYLLTNALALLVTSGAFAPFSGQAAAFVGLALAVAMVFAHGAYESIMPLHRKFSAPRVVHGFQQVAGEVHNVDYNFLRTWKHEFIGSDAPQHLKVDLERNLAMRKQLTYLFSTLIVAAPLTGIVAFLSASLRDVAIVELGLSLFVLLLATVGHLNRSHALGRAYGHAFNWWRRQANPPLQPTRCAGG